MAKSTVPTAKTVQDAFRITRMEMSEGMIERQDEVDMILTSLIAQEHCLLVGDPGTGKSMLADALVEWVDGNKFSILFNKFSTPEEVFGPISIVGLKHDEYRRIITGKVPEATVAFLDEIFKSSSAILNTMLKILNERVYQNGNDLLHCPLKLAIAASNEWPTSESGKELNALFDRFLFRRTVRKVSTDKGLDRLLWGETGIKLSTKINSDDIETAFTESQRIEVSPEAKAAFWDILKDSKREGIIPGDRRVRKSVNAAKAYAYLSGSETVEPDHLECLTNILWEDPEEQPKKLNAIIAKIANPTGLVVNGLLLEAEQVVSNCKVTDLSQASVATKKLGEIHKKLKGTSGDKAKSAADHVQEQIRKIKLATVEAL